jgi:hypothetical protein
MKQWLRSLQSVPVGASVELRDHATSLIQGVGSNIHHLLLAQINKSMHLGMVFH